jgi:glycosyltransferase involved in cell wall biosynthesis
MAFSVLIPAHNEEDFIEGCLSSIKKAEAELGAPVEIVVCLNRCTDKTEEIARQFGAVITVENEKNLSRIRNAAAKVATGDVFVTIDADSRMSANMLKEISRLLSTGRFIGGGTRIKPERLSLGIFISCLVILYYTIRFGIRSAGLFWCLRKDFNAIKGFKETLLTIEDLDFANRLAEYGKAKNLKFGTAWKAAITTSCRKFDKFGDWYLVKNPGVVRALFKGNDKVSANRFYYDVEW